MKHALYPLAMVLLLLSANSCTQELREPQTLPVIEKFALVQDNSAVLSFAYDITHTGGSRLVQHGIVYSTHPTPSLRDHKALGHTLSGNSYAGSADKMEPNTIYYVSAFATNETGTAYSLPEKITLITKIVKLTLTPPASVVKVGETLRLKLEVTPSGASSNQLIWASSNPAILTPSDDGRLIGKAPGKVFVTVSDSSNPSIYSRVEVSVVANNTGFINK